MDQENQTTVATDQEAAKRFWNAESYVNVSDWMDFAIQVGSAAAQACPVDVDDIPTSAECEACEGTGIDPETEDVCNECDDGQIHVEIMEWYAVTKWLGRKLAERGEIVLEGEYWGRQGTGQSVWIDDVIASLAAEFPR